MQLSARQYTDGPTVQQFGSRLAMDQGVHPSRSKVDRAKELAQKRWPQGSWRFSCLGPPHDAMGTFLEQNVTFCSNCYKDSPQILSICVTDPVGTSGSCAGRACHSQSRRSEGRSIPRRSTMILVRRKKCAWSLFKVKTLRISHNWGELGLHRSIKIRRTVPLKAWDKNRNVFAMPMSRYPRYVMIWRYLKARQEEREQSASSANHPWPLSESGSAEYLGEKGTLKSARFIGFYDGVEKPSRNHGQSFQKIWSSFAAPVVTLWFSIILKIFNKIYLFPTMIFHGKVAMS